MTLQRFVLAMASVALTALPATAQSVKLLADDIRALLSGNTAIGTWDGIPYRQYFAPDGVTIYAQENARSARGAWRIDPMRDEYQSLWPGDADWEGWYVMTYAGDYYWVSKSTPPTPFRLETGQQLVAAPAGDGEFCAALQTFMQAPGTSDLTEIALPTANAPEASCTTSLAPSGQRSQHCHWLFDYRADTAQVAFTDTITAVTACLGPADALQDTSVVNHPDSYDQRQFTGQTGTLSVSLKDKGALQKTALFLRMDPAGN